MIVVSRAHTHHGRTRARRCLSVSVGMTGMVEGAATTTRLEGVAKIRTRVLKYCLIKKGARQRSGCACTVLYVIGDWF